MAIYHFSAKIISRASGRSAVAAAAYRSASRLNDERLDRDHDFTNKSGVIHSEVMLPENAPDRLADREKLWNEVEATEKRKDAQLSREVEFAIPREMAQAQGVELARDFTQREFVDRGMIADLNIHWDVGANGVAKPHAHVMLTMREVGEDGFGAKVRDWNRTKLVEHWRERWADHVNERLMELDIDARIDHRSLEAQGIELEPQDKIGPAAQRMGDRGLESERIEDHREIARRNGERIIAEPRIALDAITHGQSTFTRRDLALFVHRHSDGKEQFDQAMGAVGASPELVALGKDGRGDDRFTSRDMIETEERLEQAVDRLVSQHGHGLLAAARDWEATAAGSEGLALGREQQAALEHITGRSGLAIVVGYAGTGKSAMLGVARDKWEAAGFEVRGAALSGIAAEGLKNGSGIASRTIAAHEHQWNQGRERLTSRDVLVIDEAGMVGTRQMERVLSHAAEAGAKVVLVGDPQQLQAIEAGAAFRAIHERQGGVEISEVRRQCEDWQRDATRHLATGRTDEAIRAYDEHGMVHAAATRDQARGALVERWERERIAAPDQTRIILAHTNEEVWALNEAARGRMRDSGELGDDALMKTVRGQRQFASGDRIMFLKNERGLGVKNGTLGTIEQVSERNMNVRSDTGLSVSFDTKDYAHVDHGYAATIHKAQGMTVDRAHMLATPGMDSHSAYVGLSRHRDGVQLHYGRDDFADQSHLVRTLSRERAKDMAADYERADPAQAFAERRGVSFRERVAEIARKVPEKVRGIFANFRPGQQAHASVPAEPSRSIGQRYAVERYARAWQEIGQMRDQGLPVLPHQREVLEKARDALDTIRPHGSTDLDAAIQRTPELAREAAAGRSQAAIRAMQLEAGIRADPFQRADRFVEGWQRLQRHREDLQRDGDLRGARKVAEQMAGMAKSLERDAQMESLLRPRRGDLGIGMETGRSLARDLAASVPLQHTRHLGMSR
ncbi:Ti-type conjugative transfer relaxase TraA [Sphingomonadaceae bacterium G21617-S1]|nr:Ti-type conjugative transfer relaxase TraA [Sphingomonadaceae bacterium G21617-S1]